jgi:adenosine deaminase
MQKNLKQIINEMPKAELHLHLEATPQWSSIRQAFARHYGETLPEISPLYHPEFRFKTFQEFLNGFVRYIHPWLRTPNGYAELIDAAIDSLIQQNIRYVELNFSILSIQRVNHHLEDVLSLLEKAINRAKQQGCMIKLIAGISRNQIPEIASKIVKQLLSYSIISGFDLHGFETPETRADLFREAFEPAQAADKKIKAHAGEMDGPASIRAAVAGLGVTQIGHGTSAVEDAELVQLLIERNIVLEMCPSSNEKLGNIHRYDDHPILALDAAGVRVTVNSDDPSLFGVHLTDEMVRLVIERGVTIADLVRWTRNAFNCAIVDADSRHELHRQLDTWAAAYQNFQPIQP